MKTIAETERLRVREFTVEDGRFVLELVNTEGWLKFIGNRGVSTIEEAQLYLITGPMNSYEKNGFGLYLVELKEGSIPVGMCGLLNREELEDIDLGFAFLPRYYNMGFAFESATAVINFATNTLDLRKLLAITTEYNQRSVRLLEKLGFIKIGKTKFKGEKEELFVFSIELNTLIQKP